MSVVLLAHRLCDIHVKHMATCSCRFGVGYQCSTEVCVSVSVCVCSDDVDLATDPDLVMWSALLVTM